MLTRLAVCAAMATARLAELALSRRNIAGAGPAAEGTWSRRTFPLIVSVHSAVIAGTAVFGRRRAHRLPLLALLLAQPLRLWVLLTLGRRWNARAAVPQEMDVATTGPYAFVRHPNYSVVALELACLPAAFGLWRLTAGASAVNAALLALRIREEEAALFALPGYREHFEGLARFVPGVW